MLVLSRKKNEGIVIGDGITLIVVEIRGDKVRLAIECPHEVSVHRQEVWEAIHGTREEGPAALVRIDPAWLAWNDRTIPRLARAICDERAWDRLPILADALEDAGCGDDRLLEHLRGSRPHAHGCWVLDALLGPGQHRGQVAPPVGRCSRRFFDWLLGKRRKA